MFFLVVLGSGTHQSYERDMRDNSGSAKYHAVESVSLVVANASGQDCANLVLTEPRQRHKGCLERHDIY